MADTNHTDGVPPREHTFEEPRRKAIRPGWLLLGLAVALGLVIAVFVVVFAFTGDDEELQDRTLLINILEEPEEYFGEEVLTSGVVESVVNEYAFILETDEVIVLVPAGVQGTRHIVESNPVLIRGTVIEFDLETASLRVGEDLSEEEFGQFNGEVALLAAGVTSTLDEPGFGQDPPEIEDE